MIHYFPPFPNKIGDNLLTLDIALQLIKTKKKLAYYAFELVAEILERFDIKNIQYIKVPSIEYSIKLAKQLRSTAPTVDLQQLNFYYDKPHYRNFFDEDIHPRAKCDWYDPKTIEQWGLLYFSDVFRQMLNMPKIDVERPLLRVNKRNSSQLLLFPHSVLPLQQLDCWADIAKVAVRHLRTGIVGKAEVKQLAVWPAGIDFYCDLSGGELVDVIGNASICIGGSTGLSHLAAELELPLLMILKCNDSAIFKPIRNNTVTILAAEENFSFIKISKSKILDAVDCFLSQANL